MKTTKIALIALLAASLTGCVVPQGEIRDSRTVGQVKYLGGTGLVYARSNGQVSAASIREGEAILAARQNDAISADQDARRAQREETRIAEEKADAFNTVARKCNIVIEVHEEQLRQVAQKTRASADIKSYYNFIRGGRVAAFNKCVKTNS